MCVYLFFKGFAHIECYSDCSHRGSNLVDSFVTVLFNVCSAVTVEPYFDLYYTVMHVLLEACNIYIHRFTLEET